MINAYDRFTTAVQNLVQPYSSTEKAPVGKIVEEGTHYQLLKSNGLYAGFWGRQSGGFIGIEHHSDGSC